MQACGPLAETKQGRCSGTVSRHGARAHLEPRRAGPGTPTAVSRRFCYRRHSPIGPTHPSGRALHYEPAALATEARAGLDRKYN